MVASPRTVPSSEIESFIDRQLSSMLRAPLMWGDPFALECSGFLLMEFYELFGKEKGEPRCIAPAHEEYQSFARKMHPSRPGPMTMAQWFTDLKWGSKKNVKVPPDQLKHVAGTKIVEFFIAWKAHLKATEPTEVQPTVDG